MINKTQLIKEVFYSEDNVIKLIHHLHKIPEIALKEVKTSAFIRSILEENNIPYRCVDTGTIVDFDSDGSRARIALRADIDGLRITENTNLEYSSEHFGMMHACGHDCNAAMLLASAIIIKKHEEDLPGPVRLIFQPAEEASGGAEKMIEAGCLEDVASIYCLHMNAHRQVGQFATKAGIIHASSDGFIARIIGKKAHASSPEAGIDAIVATSAIIQSLQSLISREIGAFSNAVLTIGKIKGGTARNIVCGEVEFEGTLRTHNPQLRNYLKERITDMIKTLAHSYKADAYIEFVQSYCPCFNDEEATNSAISMVKDLFGNESIDILERGTMGGEDFGFYEQLVPGCKLHLGTGCSEDIHTSTFRINEETLKYGVGFFCGLSFL